VNCFSYKADVGSDSLSLFTICQRVLGSVLIWIHKEPYIREERALAHLLTPMGDLEWRDC